MCSLVVQEISMKQDDVSLEKLREFIMVSSFPRMFCLQSMFCLQTLYSPLRPHLAGGTSFLRTPRY